MKLPIWDQNHLFERSILQWLEDINKIIWRTRVINRSRVTCATISLKEASRLGPVGASSSCFFQWNICRTSCHTKTVSRPFPPMLDLVTSSGDPSAVDEALTLTTLNLYRYTLCGFPYKFYKIPLTMNLWQL